MVYLIQLYYGQTPVNGHPWDQKKWLLKRGVRLWDKNVVHSLIKCGVSM